MVETWRYRKARGNIPVGGVTYHRSAFPPRQVAFKPKASYLIGRLEGPEVDTRSTSVNPSEAFMRLLGGRTHYIARPYLSYL